MQDDQSSPSQSNTPKSIKN